MLKLRAVFGLALVAGLVCSGRVWAGEVDDLKAELADMKAKIASMEGRYAPAMVDGSGGGDASSLSSMNKGVGAITIGGDVNVDLIYTHRDDVTSDHDAVDSTQFHTNSANLRFKVAASKDSFLYIKLDLDDAWYDDRLDGDSDQDDLLEECQYVFKNIKGSPFDFIFGKGEVPYGQDKTLGVIQSYNHNHSSFFGDNAYTSEGPEFILNGAEEGSDANNPHLCVGDTAHPGEVDNVFLAQVNYTWRELLRFQFAVFQNADYNGNTYLTRGMYEDKSDDDMLFRSVAARVWFAPTETLTLELSLINMHSDNRNDTDIYGDYTTPDQQAISFGFDYKSKSVPVEVFGEYQHGFNWGYTENYWTDSAQLGMIWGMTGSLDLGIMYEWLGINNENTIGGQDYQKFVVSGQYELKAGMKLILEYGYEYFNADLGGGGDDDRDGHLIAFRTSWSF